MKEIIFYLSVIIWVIYTVVCTIVWPDSMELEVAKVAPPEIKAAMQKMGPYYDYIIVNDKLYVNTGDGKWLNLRYEGR